ncbi:hypothetical protein DPMN_061510 [Dreissena polymorpha]|uniref:Uncharacterized protein n=1 Tax=Dreissena polymorpha TaxID=45954 RepID=A0A9D4C7U2_DREPO|nr:hypothetical protein DPMN_061510 [Dreissena polymorpha]
MDRDVRQILAEVVTESYGVIHPISVYYSQHTNSIMAGMGHNNDMNVFKKTVTVGVG